MISVLRWSTAGESHGPALVALIEGVPSGVELSTTIIADELARRRLGYGRGARMSFEKDAVRILGGVRLGRTLGSPIAIEIANSEWPKWEQVMSADPVDADLIAGSARGAALTRPRPGHADLSGMLKYNHEDARPVLERASARETAARVALGAVAKQYLRQLNNIEVYSHVISVGASAPYTGPIPLAKHLADIDASPVRAFDHESEAAMVAEIEAAKSDGDTLGGVIEVIASDVPIGVGTYVVGEQRLDAALAGAVMSINAIKGVEIGDGFETARRRGSVAHDEIIAEAAQLHRETNRAGGIEGGMSNGEPIIVRAAMKPISTVPKALRTVDTATGEAAVAIHQRSDICAVPAAGVVGEAMVALTVARAAAAKFGGDSIVEARENVSAYLKRISHRHGYITGAR